MKKIAANRNYEMIKEAYMYAAGSEGVATKALKELLAKEGIVELPEDSYGSIAVRLFSALWAAGYQIANIDEVEAAGLNEKQ